MNTQVFEMVDIVDEDNQILYKVSKQEAHQKGLLYRTVVCPLIDLSGNFTFVIQADDRQDAGQFVFPVGGHQSSGESEVDAIKREAMEEIGLVEEFKTVSLGKFIYSRKTLGRSENHYFIIYEIHSDHLPKLNHESVSYQKFSKSGLKKILKEQPERFGPPVFKILENFYPELLEN